MQHLWSRLTGSEVLSTVADRYVRFLPSFGVCALAGVRVEGIVEMIWLLPRQTLSYLAKATEL
jgi:hypothetical protein